MSAGVDRTKAAIEEYASARHAYESGEYHGTELGMRLQADNALCAVTVAARASVKPHESIALEISGFRRAMDILAIEGPDDCQLTFEQMKDELEASVCQCGGSGQITQGHPNDPASTRACPDCGTHNRHKPWTKRS